MYWKGFILLAVISLVQYTNALPRDVGVVNVEAVSMNSDLTMKVNDFRKASSESLGVPGRVTCPYEEATEYPICQEHCLPKGYSYGICVGGTCSCI